MKNTEVIFSSLSLGENKHIPGRYSVNPIGVEKDKLLDIHFDFTNSNFCRIQELYFGIY